MFQSERLVVTHGFDLPRAAELCLPLFTPKGELAWVPDWAPHFLYPSDGTTERGMVFTTASDGITTTWAMTVHAPAEGRVAYVRMTPGLRAVSLSVTCRPVTPTSCTVSVSYELTGLSDAGNAANRDFAAGFATMIDGWKTLILAHFEAEAV